MKIVKPTDRTTLLLDFAYLPINVITARAAFHHFLKNKIKGLDKNQIPFSFEDWNEDNGAMFYKDQPCLRSAKDVWLLPTVAIVTEHFFRKPRKKEYSFEELCLYYKNTCQICLEKFPRSQLSIEHIYPRKLHGTNLTSNRSITCKRCNAKKGHAHPYYNKEGKLLKQTKIPANFIFIEDNKKREEWNLFTFNQ